MDCFVSDYNNLIYILVMLAGPEAKRFLTPHFLV